MQLQFVSGVDDGVGGGVGDGPGGSVAGGSPLEPHDPELGLPLHVQRESLLHAPLLSMVEQLNFCGATFESTIHKVKKCEVYYV